MESIEVTIQNLERTNKDLQKQVNRLSRKVGEQTKLLEIYATGVLTVQQAALFGIYEVDTLYNLISENKILAYRPTPKRILIDAEYFIKNFLKTNPNFEEDDVRGTEGTLQ